ncbi:zinc finger, C2H2 type [Cooperia oncophora]
MRVTENCVVCGHGPLYLNPLYDHYRRSHFWSKAQIEKEKLRIQIKTGNNRCEICNKLFSTLHSLKIHNQRKHPKGTSMKLICPECGQRFTTHLLLAAHCSDSHTSEPATQDFSIITGRFESYAAFEEWKDYLESTSLMNFTKRYAMPCKTGGQQHFFFCRYARKKTKGSSGAEESGIEEPREKSSIPSHSKRKPAHCPAFIKVSFLAM